MAYPRAELPPPRRPVLAGLRSARAEECSQWWNYARHSAHALRAGRRPPTITVLGPVPEADELALLSSTAAYSRLYGRDGEYAPASLLVVGRPAVTFGALTVQAIINHRRKKAVKQAAAVQWRDQQTVGVIATTKRILCNTMHGLISAYYETVTEFHPDLENWTLTMGFGPEFAALRLQGPAAAALNLWAAQAILGADWVRDPRLAPLLT
jgi:hypothetical protein